MRIGREKFKARSRQTTGRSKPVESSCGSPTALPSALCHKFARPNRNRRALGFTLFELMIVMTIILILASMATPTYHTAIVRAREAVLRDDLYTLRTLIDQYTLDKQHPPATLQDLIDDGYLHGALPVDPFTQSNQTWQTVLEEVPISPNQTVSGIVDVHSGSDDISTDGAAYSSW